MKILSLLEARRFSTELYMLLDKSRSKFEYLQDLEHKI